jgi:hypothetical protein
MLARVGPFSPLDGSRARSRSRDGAGLHSSLGAIEPRRQGPGRGSVTPLAGRTAGEHIRGSGTFLSLVQICLAELRTDLARLFESSWAEPEQNRACELAKVLHQACEQQGLRQLAAVMRSVAMLAGLVREEAIPLYPELKRQFKVLLLLGEKSLLERHPAAVRA